MNKKLTLSMDEAVIEAAKEYAQKKGKSLSSILENILITTTGLAPKKKKSNTQKHSDTPLVDELISIIENNRRSKEEIEAYEKDLYERKPYMKERMEYYDKKHGYR